MAQGFSPLQIAVGIERNDRIDPTMDSSKTFCRESGFMTSTYPKERYSLVDIDGRLQYIVELATALGIEPSTLTSHILTPLKLQLNNKIKNASSAKRQRLLECLFPYSVLKDYSRIVTYLLENENDIPESIMDILLHDASYKSFLIPSIKAKIYKKRNDYFQADLKNLFASQPTGISVETSVISKYRWSDPDKIASLFFSTGYALVVRVIR